MAPRPPTQTIGVMRSTCSTRLVKMFHWYVWKKFNCFQWYLLFLLAENLNFTYSFSNVEDGKLMKYIGIFGNNWEYFFEYLEIFGNIWGLSKQQQQILNHGWPGKWGHIEADATWSGMVAQVLNILQMVVVKVFPSFKISTGNAFWFLWIKNVNDCIWSAGCLGGGWLRHLWHVPHLYQAHFHIFYIKIKIGNNVLENITDPCDQGENVWPLHRLRQRLHGVRRPQAWPLPKVTSHSIPL